MKGIGYTRLVVLGSQILEGPSNYQAGPVSRLRDDLSSVLGMDIVEAKHGLPQIVCLLPSMHVKGKHVCHPTSKFS